MLTPTGISASDYINAIKAGNPTHARLTFSNQNIVLEDEDITSEGIEIKSYLNGDIDLTLGKAIMTEVTASLFRNSKTQDLQWMDEFTLEFGVDVDEEENGVVVTNTYWVTVGYFTGDRPERSVLDNVIQFTAHDRMKKFDVIADDYLRTLTFSAQNPISLSTIYSGLCTYCGVASESGDELSNIMGRTFTESPFPDNGMTCRDALAKIAEACGCYARITAGGKVKMVWYTDHMEDYVVNGDEEFSIYVMELDLITNPSLKMKWVDLEGIKWQELKYMLWGELEGWEQPFKVLALRVKMMEDDVGVIIPSSMNRNVYLIVDNQLLATSNATEETNYLYPLYTRLADFGAYIPASIKCVGNWLVEPGDIISAEVGKNNFIRLPIFTRTLKWDGACTDAYEATGNLNREIVSPSNYQTMTSRGRYHIFRNDINELYSEINNPTTGLATRVSQTESNITLLASNKSTTYIDANAPAGTTSKPLVEGDLWIESDNNNKLYRYNGSSWEACEYSDPNKYTVQSGIEITANGVEITGSKYIHLQADTNTKWYIDNQGLSLFNTVRNRRAMQFGGSFDSQDLSAEAGVYAYNPGGDTTHGRLAFVASDMVSMGYNFAILEYDYNKGLIFKPYTDLAMRLGDSTHRFGLAYIGYLYSHYIMGNDSNGEFVMNPSANADRQICFSDYTGSTSLGIKGYTRNGGGWDVRNIIFTGQIVAPSSKSMKHNIKELKSVSETIDKLSPVEFAYNNDPQDKKHFGLIYEDTIGIIPEICQENQGKDGKKDKSINYVELVPLLLKEIQDLRKRVAELEKEVKK